MSSEMFKQFEARGLSSPYATDFMAYSEVNGKIVILASSKSALKDAKGE